MSVEGQTERPAAAGEPPVLVQRDGGIVRLTLNRPAQRNALDAELASALTVAVQASSADASTRVIVIAGAGSAFCAGARLDSLLDASERGDVAGVTASFGVVERVYRALLAARPPIIAVVNGPALAGGAGIVGASDLAIGSERASLGYPEVLLGLTPGMVMTLLVRQAGLRAALDLALTGRRVAADEAVRLGLLTEVVPEAELEARVTALAETLAVLSPAALAATKRWAWTLAEAGTHLEQGRDLSTLLAMTDEARTGMRAFFQRASGSRPSGPA
ncbi:MAG: enoyl-CoA hydratase/isomerase family protein [Chloroflexi bacterium]|nr:enoyl-CoA hydratase/isomerase family protein [Chloroflexota bacterium]